MRGPGSSAERGPELVVAIDGPAGAGKTTVARGVAAALGLAHLDTGAMYRALTSKALGLGIDPEDGERLVDLARATSMDFTAEEGLTIDGTPAGQSIRTRAVSNAVSIVAAHPGVRGALVRMQREIMARGGIVAEGRDIGTVVCPAADVKVFLTASIAERARRRHAELLAAGEDVAVDDLQREVVERDRLDSTREASPLLKAPDAVEVDTTDKTAGQVIDEITAMARAVMQGAS